MLDESLFDPSPSTPPRALNKLPANPESSSFLKGRFPSWLHRKLPQGGALFKTGKLLAKYRLNTVCEEAKCPNRFECYAQKTATFLALGKACTRSCGFCDIDFTKSPLPPEEDEPERIAYSVRDLGLKHVVLTMVARDDLPDGGASHMASIIHKVRAVNPFVTVEVLTSDLAGNRESLDRLLEAPLEIFNHNIETVRSLTPRVRHKATYNCTLDVLRYVKGKNKVHFVKSGIMLGLGESPEEVEETIRDLYAAGCDIITIGQYLQADRRKLPVKAFISPQQFKAYEEYGYQIGVKYMYCGPFVRSSYNAHFINQKLTEPHG